MNKQNKNKIEWCDYTWSPVVGCKHNCSYCYSKRLNDRFGWLEDFTKPEFYPERLKEPYKLKKPSKIFVGSMCDMMGNWMPVDWINKTIQVAKDNPRHIFQFLTKNPKRYLEFKFPSNCQLGATITDNHSNSGMRVYYLNQLYNYKFVSIEPLLGSVDMLNLNQMDLVIVGAMTGPNAIKPKKEWIASIKHPKIFWKNNIKEYL